MTGPWERLAALAAAGLPVAVCTIIKSTGSVPRRAGARMLVFPDGSSEGSVGGAGFEEKVKAAARKALAENHKPAVHEFNLWYRHADGLDSLCGGSVTVFIEAMPRAPHVLIFGGGHVGLALARMLDVLEYSYTVIDDRPEYADAERFPGASECFCGRPGDYLSGRDLTGFTHALLLGYSYELDLEALALLLPNLPGYVGLIGSRAKAAEFRTRLEQRGVGTADIARLRCPIGVAIRSETAAEVAAAIAAELVDTAYTPAAPRA